MDRTSWVRRLAIASLLVAPFVALLWVPTYTRVEPNLFGFPFFYWYLMAWVPLSAICTSLAYMLIRRQELGGKGGRGGRGGRADSEVSR